MRLLVVSDIHYALRQYDWVLKVAGDFDVVVLAGDHLDINSSVAGHVQSAVVRRYFARIRQRTTLIVCSGNHDLDARNGQGEKVANWLLGPENDGLLSDWQSFEVKDTLFTACPWWDGPVVRDEIGAMLAKAAETRKTARKAARWIWLYHAPPDNSPVAWDGSGYFGEDQVRKWIEQYQPDLVFAGHSHFSPFIDQGSWVDRIGKSWVFNAGREAMVPPSHIILDTEIGEAVWLASEGAQSVDLAAALERPVRFLDELPAWLNIADQAPDRSQA